MAPNIEDLGHQQWLGATVSTSSLDAPENLKVMRKSSSALSFTPVAEHLVQKVGGQLDPKAFDRQSCRNMRRSWSNPNLAAAAAAAATDVPAYAADNMTSADAGFAAAKMVEGPCAICVDDLKHPVELGCGHKFCHKCLTLASLEANLSKTCPMCRVTHELNPDVLRQRSMQYRNAYKSWRQGGLKGAKGETSDIGRPISTDESVPADGKAKEQFRNYEDSDRHAIVQEFYRQNHVNQTYEFARDKIAKYGALRQKEMTVWEVIELLDTIVDDSDPDTDVPNSFHDFQTAERIRAQWPEHDWFHLVGLLHDLGKILCCFGEPQWCVVGDTFPLGCKFSDKIVFPQFFNSNPDKDHAVYSTEHGVYEPGCGISNVVMSYGHDEYMYNVLVGNNCPIPEEGLYMIRFHSFYPWHKEREYMWMENEKDREMMPWVLEFNKFDLYSKSDELPDPVALRPYYQSLIDKYCPGKLRW